LVIGCIIIIIIIIIVLTRSVQPKPPAVRPPERSILCQLQGLGRCDTGVTADLVNPGGGRQTKGTSQLHG